MATCDPQVLMTAAASFATLPGTQLQILTTALLAEILISKNPMANTSPQSLMDSAKCFMCLSPGQIPIVQTQLLCEILNAGGSSGSGCILSGVVDPTIAPSGCTDALYINRSSGSFWYWDNVLSQWFSLIV